MKLHTLESRLQALAVFRALLDDPVVKALLACLAHNIDGATWDALGAYGEFTARLYRGGGNLARYVQRLVEERVAEELLAGRLRRGDGVKVSLRENELAIEREKE